MADSRELTFDFYPRPPRGGRPQPSSASRPSRQISIHALREEGDQSFMVSNKAMYGISIHALREEGDPVYVKVTNLETDFYPRPPRGGRPEPPEYPRPQQQISIHALREEGDQRRKGTRPPTGYFYPRPPRGGRPVKLASSLPTTIFLSTPSARRAT